MAEGADSYSIVSNILNILIQWTIVGYKEWSCCYTIMALYSDAFLEDVGRFIRLQAHELA